VGLVTPIGGTAPSSWEALLAGKCGVGRLEDGEGFDALPCRVAARVARADGGGGGGGDGEAGGGFDADALLGVGSKKRMAPFIQFAVAAADEACAQAGWDGGARAEGSSGSSSVTEEQRERAGVSIGSGIGSIEDVVDTASVLSTRGHRRVSPHFVPKMLINLAAGQVSLKHGLRAANLANAAACAAGAQAIAEAFRAIKFGEADLMVAGGAEACVHPVAVSGFCRLNALSTKYNDAPTSASRPFDVARDGFVMGEGAGMLVLESYEHAVARGAGGRILAELRGVGAAGDAHHITAPADDGGGARRAMAAALAAAGLEPADVTHINAHATSTPMGDAIEARAIEDLFGNDACASLTVSATKGATGHLLGAAGAIEAVFTVLAVVNDVAPPTLNADDPEATSFAIAGPAPGGVTGAPIRAALCNSFGFGGTNACLAFTKPPAL